MNRLGEVELPSGPEGPAGVGHPFWVDRIPWSPVEQRRLRTLGAVLHVREVALSGGRPITLQFEDTAWLSQDSVDGLTGLAATVGSHDLVLDGETRRVVFLRDGQEPLQLRPAWPFADVYFGSIRLIEVSN